MPAWPFEKPGFNNNPELKSQSAKADPDGSIEEIRAYLENNVTDKKARVFNKLNFQDETNVNADMAFNHFFMMDATPDAKPVEITKGYYRFNGAEFTPGWKTNCSFGRYGLQAECRPLRGKCNLYCKCGWYGTAHVIGRRRQDLQFCPAISPSR